MKKTRVCIAQLVFAAWLMVLVVCALPGPASAQSVNGGADAQMLFPDADFFEQIQPEPVFAARASGGIHASDLPDSKTIRQGASFRTMAAHKYLGYTTLALTALAAVTNSSHEIHRAASYGAAWLAGASCATGFAGYGNVIDLSEGISTHDTHAVFGIIGTAALVATLVIAEADNDSGHGGIGGASAAALGISVVALKIEW